MADHVDDKTGQRPAPGQSENDDAARAGYPSPDRKERLAEALRANLRRRKEQKVRRDTG